MIKHSLNCLLKDDKLGSFKTARLTSKPSIEKLRDIYFANLESLKYIVKFCQEKNIKSLRVVSGLFPLASQVDYRDKVLNLLDEVGKEYGKIDYTDVELSSHPDQFILLSSANPNVNANSRVDLEIYAYMRKYIPWNLVNIHVGSAALGHEHHRKIFKEEFNKLSKEAKNILSIENDEKSYGFLETLEVAMENGCMVVPDFHHQRCFVKRTQEDGKGLSQEDHFKWNEEIDKTIYENIDKIVSCYKHTTATPTFHISSPIEGWTGIFKEHCIHADYIEPKDYPGKLHELSAKLGLDFRLDIEAKAKEKAIFKLENRD
jgi:UV DNA damage endonuclease